MGRRTLLLSAPLGAGHLQAALALAQAIAEQGDPDDLVQAVNVDSLWLNLLAFGYLALLNQAPSTWRSLYRAPVGTGKRQLISTALGPAVARLIRHMDPDIVIATHPFVAIAAAAMRRSGELRAPLGVVLTDFIPHPLWIEHGIDQYYVASGEAALRLVTMGAAPGSVYTTGIPVRHNLVCGAHGALPLSHNVLVMGGGLGLGPITETVRSLAQLPQRTLRVTVVCGNNTALRQELTDLFASDPRIEVLGFTHGIPELMAQAALLITKPGGITSSEALASGLPMLLLDPLPGHEEENAAYLLRTGAALMTDEIWAGPVAAQLLFGDQVQLCAMRTAARAAGRPDAAARIAKEIFILSTRNHHHDATA